MFAPAQELEHWARTTFIDEGSALLNDDHIHLRSASIGMLWTSVANTRNMKMVVGQAEMGQPRAMGKWAKARAEWQIENWFGIIPDFIITIDANYAKVCEDAEFCSLLEHELYHCAQQVDEWGSPKFNKQTGRPMFGMRGHDVEEFVGIVRRYGAGAAAGSTAAMIQAAQERPEIAAARIASVCGTCLAKAA